VFLVVALALSIAGVLLYRTTAGERVLTSLNDKTGGQIPGAPTDAPLTIVDARPFDPPPGDGHEDDADVKNVLDGNPKTAWHTEQYDTRKMGNIKPGVGLLLTLKQASTLKTLTITSPTQDWAASVYVSDQPGATLADWKQPVASFANNNGNAAVDLQGAQGQYVLIWITDLGNGPPRVSAEIDDVAITGH
jgi:hypothetical protein